MMNLIHTRVLTETQKMEICSLAEECRKAEPITLSMPCEDGLDYYLVYEKDAAAQTGVLAGFSFLFFVPQDDEPGSCPLSQDDESASCPLPQDDALPQDAGGQVSPPSIFTCEYTALVHPKLRRRGYFTEMLNDALKQADRFEQEHNCQVDFCFLTDEKSPAATAVLNRIGAEYWYSEYKMTRTLRSSDRAYQAKVRIEEADDANPHTPDDGSRSCGVSQSRDDSTSYDASQSRDDSRPHSVSQSRDDSTSYDASQSRDDSRLHSFSRLYTASMGTEVIGTCALLPCKDGVYLYAFQIKEAWQGKGYGTDFLQGMLSLLADQVFHHADTPLPSEDFSVSIQVSGLNYIARNLYKKTGFREVEALSYYLY